MHNRKKIILFAAIIFAIAIVLFFFLGRDKPVHHESAFQSIPDDVEYVVQIHNLPSLANVIEQHRIFDFLAGNDEIQKHVGAITKLTSILLNSEETAEIVKSSSLLVAYSSAHDEYIFSCGLSTPLSFSDFAKLIAPIGKAYELDNVSERRGEKMLILSGGNDSVYAAHLDNVLTFSKNKDLVLASVNAAESENQGKWSSFASHKKSENEHFALFSMDGSLSGFLEKYFYKNSMFPFSMIPDSGSIAFVFSQSDMSVLITGENSMAQSHGEVDFVEAENWKRAFDDVAMSAVVSTPDLQMPDEVKSVVGKTAMELLFLPQHTEIIATSVLLLKVKDTLAFTKSMIPLTQNISDRLMKNYDFQDFSVRLLKNETVFGHNQFVNCMLPDYRYYCLVNNVAIFAPSPHVIEKVLLRHSEYSLQLDNTMVFQDKLMLKIQLPMYYPFLMASVKPDYADNLELLYPYLAAFTNIEFSFTEGDTHMLHIDVEFEEDGGFGFLEDFTNNMIQQVLFRNENKFEVMLSFPELAFEGHADGNHTFYFADSTVSAYGSYVDGLASGTWRFYYEDGAYQASVEFVKGEPHGRAVFYRRRPDGKMHVSCSFQKNALEGQYVEFHKNGKPALSVLFNNNQMNGKVRAYYPSGIIMAEAEMKSNEIISDYLLYASSGDFLDPSYFTTTSFILNNYRAFIVANSVIFLNNAP
jgi:antitoxin component YwqK of YwqJK toxin-antitoxin module